MSWAPRACALVVLLCLAGLPGSASSQVIRGVVFDHDHGAPVVGATVVVLTDALRVVDSLRTGALGTFELAVGPGSYAVSVSTDGYVDSSPDMVTVGASDELQLTVGLKRLPHSASAVTLDEDTPSYLMGRVVDAVSNRPLPAARITLTGTDRSVTSGQDGRFRLGDAPLGSHVLRVEALGYEVADVPIESEPGIAHHVLVPMADRAIELEGITVTTRPRLGVRILEPAYERMSRSLGGQFLGPEELERRGTMPVADVLQSLLSVKVRGNRFHRTIEIRQTCRPAVYLDGVRVARPGHDASEFLAMSTSVIEIIEVYSGAATLPAEFAPGAMCAVALWTRR